MLPTSGGQEQEADGGGRAVKHVEYGSRRTGRASVSKLRNSHKNITEFLRYLVWKEDDVLFRAEASSSGVTSSPGSHWADICALKPKSSTAAPFGKKSSMFPL